MSMQPRLKRWISIGAIVFLAVAGTTIAGIQGTGFRLFAAIGTVDTSSDGLRVNGVPYDTSHARVTVNGRPGDVSELHTGHIVTVDGSVSTTIPIANEIVLESDVRGEVTSVDDAQGLFSVLGQTIRLTADTALDSRIRDFGGLRNGMCVKVSAFERTDGSFEASRVDLDLAPFQAQVRGVVQSLDRSNRTLRIGDLTVNYSVARTQGAIAEGATVIARGLPLPQEQSLFATSVQVFRGVGHAGEHGDVRGIISAFASPTDFEVNGQPVLADARTVYDLGGQSLGADVEVRVTGRFDAAGVLRAHRIQADAPNSVSPASAKRGPRP